MIYPCAVAVGILISLCVIHWEIYMRKHDYETRVKEVKEELAQNKLGTLPPGTE